MLKISDIQNSDDLEATIEREAAKASRPSPISMMNLTIAQEQRKRSKSQDRYSDDTHRKRPCITSVVYN